MSNQEPQKGYQTGTLIMAAIVFLGFVFAAFMLPVVMMAIGENRWLAVGAVVTFLIAPFVILWARGLYKRRL